MSTKKIKDIVIKVPVNIQELEGINRTEKQVLAQLQFLDNEKRGCFATNEYLANCLDLSDRQIRRIIAKLKLLKHISVAMMNRCFRTIFVNIKKIIKEGLKNVLPAVQPVSAYIKKKVNFYNYKKEPIFKRKLNIFQWDGESIEEFEIRCLEREQEGDVFVQRGYTKTTTISSNLISEMKSKMLKAKNSVLNDSFQGVSMSF